MSNRVTWVFSRLLLASVAAALVLDAVAGRLQTLDSGRAIGELVGRALGLFAFSLGAASIYVLILRRDARDWSALALGIAVIVVITALAARGEQVESHGVSFSTPGCEYSVIFPGRPEIKNVALLGFSTKEANFYLGGDFLRASCVPIRSGVNIEPSWLASHLVQLGTQNGLSNLETSSEHGSDGLYVRGRGYKQVGGRWATYGMILVIGKRSLLAVTVGSPSEGYPSNTINAFVNSIHRD